MPLTLAYIVHTLNPGGAERLALDMGIHFSTRGDAEYDRQYRVVIICLDAPGEWADIARDNGVCVHFTGRRPGKDWRLPSRLAKILRSEQVDIAHAHQYTPWFYTGLAKLLCPGVKLVFQEHGRHYPEVENPKRFWFNRLFLRHLCVAATAVSEDIRRRLVAYEGLARRQVRVIYNGVLPQPVYSASERAGIRATLGLAPDDFVVGTVGRLDPVKNLELLIDGIYQARKTYPALKGLIVGDGPEMGHLRAKVAYLKLEGHVIFTGFRPDAAQLVRLMDLFALVSFSEGTSMALLEAMAAGVCPVVTDVGGNPEIVTHRQTGWVVPSEDLAAFTAALKEAAQYETMRREFGNASQKRFQEKFEFQTMTQAYHNLYTEIAGRD